MNSHFTPPQGWMNDPNGTIILNGQYHIFYQYYPDGIKWGPMHWGHAVSEDGISWIHKNIALFPDELGYIFSGSCILDKDNISGLGTLSTPPLIAIFTSHNPETGEQQQSIAYSLDYEGFIKYDGNPIIRNTIDSNNYVKDFRDPKCFKNPILGGYSLALAVGPSIEFFHSSNLLEWTKTGQFDITQVGLTGICECPDCFKIYCDTTSKWILSFSLCGNEGSNIMPYFVGEFDGKSFIADKGYDNILLLDHAWDNYAAVTFANTDKVLMIGWGENWTYAQETPAIDFRGKMTCIKDVMLTRHKGLFILSFAPISQNAVKKYQLLPGNTLTLSTKNNGQISISVSDSEIVIDRTKAITESFHDCFNDRNYLIHTAKRFNNGPCDISVISDYGFYEIFADNGSIVFSVNTY